MKEPTNVHETRGTEDDKFLKGKKRTSSEPRFSMTQEQVEEALWQRQFAESKDVLEEIYDEIRDVTVTTVKATEGEIAEHQVKQSGKPQGLRPHAQPVRRARLKGTDDEPGRTESTD